MAEKLTITKALLGKGPRFQVALSNAKAQRNADANHRAGKCSCKKH